MDSVIGFLGPAGTAIVGMVVVARFLWWASSERKERPRGYTAARQRAEIDRGVDRLLAARVDDLGESAQGADAGAWGFPDRESEVSRDAAGGSDEGSAHAAGRVAGVLRFPMNRWTV